MTDRNIAPVLLAYAVVVFAVCTGASAALRTIAASARSLFRHRNRNNTYAPTRSTNDDDRVAYPPVGTGATGCG